MSAQPSKGCRNRWIRAEHELLAVGEYACPRGMLGGQPLPGAGLKVQPGMLCAVLATTLATTRAVPCVLRVVLATTLATTRAGPGDAPILWHGSCRPAPIEMMMILLLFLQKQNLVFT